MKKIIRITTVPQSLKGLLKGQHRFMTENGYDVLGVSSSGASLNTLAEDEHIRVQALDMTRTIAPLKDLKALWRFYRLCKKERPLIVHSHTPKAGIVGMLGAKLARVPIRLHTVAGLPLIEVRGVRRRILNVVEKITYRCATKVYPNSKGLYDFILKEKFASFRKLQIIANGSSNGIDTTKFSAKAVSPNTRQQLKKYLGIESTDFVFIFIGRLVGDKGINELIAAFSRVCTLRNSQPQPKLLLVGTMEVDLDPLKRETVEEISKNRHVLTVGYQGDVRPYFSIADALVFPSYREGFPNVVMEAGGMGLPSIVTDINGCNEIIIEGKNGLIIPARSIKALECTMIKLMVDKALYQKLQSNARRMITDRYEQQGVWQSLLKEYNCLINEKGL